MSGVPPRPLGDSGRLAELERAIIDLLATRAAGATICPSEAARRVAAEHDRAWRDLREPARQAARRLTARGEVEFTQGGQVIDPTAAKGPVRLRLTDRR